ncbi:hypothetical protein [Novosphingobium sp. PhB55]|uniref:hypothetical protein n=1 Tax=Novosphingobium sp. PhB55 TaxID=2485106 RepID=UPI001064F188|nr:hypothetical protein [Novosphingobium sp. PhB55]
MVFESDQGGLGNTLAGNPKASNFLVINEWHESQIVDSPCKLGLDGEELNLIFNLRKIGGRLVEPGRKPVVTIQLAEQVEMRTIRWLTGSGSNDIHGN